MLQGSGGESCWERRETAPERVKQKVAVKVKLQLNVQFIAVAGECCMPVSRPLQTWPDKMGGRAEGGECLYPIMNWRK